MPEFSESPPKAFKDIQAGNYPRQESVSGALEQFSDENVVGYGRESLVIVHPSNPDVVIGYVYQKDSPAKKLENFDASVVYHTHRIWSTLFPHNFPKIRSAIGGPEARTTRARVHENKDTNPAIEYPLSDVIEQCKDNGLPLPITDNFRENTIIGADGGEYYVDILTSRDNIQHFDRDNLIAYMEKSQMTEADKKKS